MFYIIAVGSNISPEISIDKAFQAIQLIDKDAKRARNLLTKPVGLVSQADFINTAFSLDTVMSYVELKIQLKKIESDMGRVASADKNGPRIIDLDIIQLQNKIIDNDYNQYYFVKQSVDELNQKRKRDK